MLRLTALLLTTLLSTTLFAGFQTVDCNNQTHLDTLQITQGDCQALEALWTAIGNGGGQYTAGWDDPTVSASQWEGITLNNNDFGVYQLIMHDSLGAETTIPEAIGTFTNIKILELHRLNFMGTIPESINSLTSLEALGLSGHQLTGPLPKLSALRSLESIFLSTNNFSGKIPQEWSTLTKLTEISVYGNKLSGPLPDFSALVNLYIFEIFHNDFDFSDIEPQISWLKNTPKAIYFSQGLKRDDDRKGGVCQYQYIDESSRIVYFDKELAIEPSVAINPSGNDHYTWYKHLSGEVSSSGERIYSKENATPADKGHYYYEANNSIVTHTKYNYYRTNLYLCGTQGEEGIEAIHDNTPTVTNQTPSEVVTEGETYIYTSMISDEDSEDNNSLVVQENTLPNWLTLTSTGSEFTLSGLAPALFGLYDINITVTDGKIPVHINYKLRVDPKTLPAGFTLSHGIYTHTTTGKSINSDTFVTFENEGVAVTGTCLNNKKPYTSIDSSGKLTTGYTDCLGNNSTETFSDPLPNNTKASIVTNNAEKMILIEIPLTQDITLQGN